MKAKTSRRAAPTKKANSKKAKKKAKKKTTPAPRMRRVAAASPLDRTLPDGAPLPGSDLNANQPANPPMERDPGYLERESVEGRR